MRYTQEQISTALVLLKATGSPDEVIRTLGYPSNPMLYHWRKKYPEYYDVPIQKHWKQASIELKHNVIKRCLIQGEPVKLVAEEIGYTSSLIYKWIREYREKGYFSPMKKTTANIDVNPTDITSAEDIQNDLNGIFNHAYRYYDLRKIPTKIVTKMGRDKCQEIEYWSKEEYENFIGAMVDEPIFFYAFETLFWTGIREGELFGLKRKDLNFEERTLSVKRQIQTIDIYPPILIKPAIFKG